MKILSRAIQLEDKGYIPKLRDKFYDEVKDEKINLSSLEKATMLLRDAHLFNNPQEYIFQVAREEEKVIGYTLARLCGVSKNQVYDSTLNNIRKKRCAEISEVYILQEHRTKGISKQLIGDLCFRLKRRKIKSVFSVVNQNNFAMQKTFLDLAFEKIMQFGEKPFVYYVFQRTL